MPFDQSITTDAKTLQTELKTDGKEKHTKKKKEEKSINTNKKNLHTKCRFFIQQEWFHISMHDYLWITYTTYILYIQYRQ